MGLMHGFIKILHEMREQSKEYWIEKTAPISETLEIVAILKSKWKQRQDDIICEDE